ncbi:protein of unknown function DUF1007 [Thioalkalivibrio nitratireducens DSM 14787]|uniref:DUF1007 family protein n=1 Tax=Thioalkalivibrio nitratireducens (strain DSM 14787 / UNIQEM 213 / ALEN2) TaxID=1255043 RepID=L0DU67_THIND|nr:DUF1007 family protein [Thioalkalivibrio nitratireducens]AGA32573.1 protein of unknown function DUF1007 [Thioalkalivibrio nitratireducens DSM 14787]
MSRRGLRPPSPGRWLTLAALLLAAGPVQTHPHAWIDLRVSLHFEPRGDLRAMRQEWILDPTYSHLLLQDMEASHPGLDLDTALDEIGTRMLADLRDYDYFTEMRRAGDRLAIPDAREGRLEWRQRRLHLSFELPLQQRRPDAETPLEYRVYDPGYWIEVLHDPDDVIHLDGGQGCTTRMDPPRPEPWLVGYAATLDRKQRTPVEDLGRAFAERVLILCDS